MQCGGSFFGCNVIFVGRTEASLIILATNLVVRSSANDCRWIRPSVGRFGRKLWEDWMVVGLVHTTSWLRRPRWVDTNTRVIDLHSHKTRTHRDTHKLNGFSLAHWKLEIATKILNIRRATVLVWFPRTFVLNEVLRRFQTIPSMCLQYAVYHTYTQASNL